jgi:hypothetical protein
MKKNSFKIFAKRTAGAVLISAFIFANAGAVEMPVKTAFHENAATVKYLGADNESYIFNVAYNNESGEKFLLRITDAEENTLFTGTYTDKKFDKRFKLLKEGSDGKLKFIIRDLKDNSVQTFEVTTTSQVVEDVVVKKVM